MLLLKRMHCAVPVDVRVRDVSLVLSARRLVWHGDRSRVVAPKALCNRYIYIISRAQHIARNQPMAPEASQAPYSPFTAEPIAKDSISLPLAAHRETMDLYNYTGPW